MKTLSIFIIILFSKYIKAQFEDDQDDWESNDRKMSEIEDKDETPKQHNFFSAHYDNLHHTGDVDNSLDLYNRQLNDRFETANNIVLNTEADKASDLARTRLQSESKLIDSNGDDVKSDGSIVSEVKIESKEVQKKPSATDYNIFDAKSTVKDLKMTSIPIIPTTLKPASDQIMKYNNITILILDENNKIYNKLSVPILNTSHIIIKAFSNNIISDLPPGSIASNGMFYQSAGTTTELATTTKTAALGKLTLTSLNSQALDHAVFSTSTQFPNSSINSVDRNSVEFKVKNEEHFNPLNTHHNEVVVTDQYKQGVFHEGTNLRTAAVLKTNENHTEHASYTTDDSMGRITSEVKSFSEQVPTSSTFKNGKQANEDLIKKSAAEDLDSKSTIEPTNLKINKSNTERDKTATAYSLKRYTENSTITTNHVDSTTGILSSYFSPTKPKETNLRNSIPGTQDLHLSLKPAILEIIEENTDRNKNMSLKNHFVNVYVPTFEFTKPKNNSMQAHQHFKTLEEGKISNSGKLELPRFDSHTKNENITSRPAQNLVHEIESSKPIDKSRTTTNEGLGHSKTYDVLSQLMPIGSMTMPTTPSVTLKPHSSQFIDHTSSKTRSLEEETNALIDILLGQQNKSTVASHDKFSSMTTTEHHNTG